MFTKYHNVSLFIRLFLLTVTVALLLSTFQVNDTTAAGSTCQRYLFHHLTGTINNVYVIGDSRLNGGGESYMTSQFGTRGLTNLDAGFTDTISGMSTSSYVSDQLASATSYISNADVIIINLGINDHWSITLNGFSPTQVNIDLIISTINSLNSNAIIVWQEEYVHDPSVLSYHLSAAASSLISAAPQLAQYQRQLDASETICLVPWAEIADADPTPYTTASPVADGVHMYSNEASYINAFLGTIDQLEDDDTDGDGVLDTWDSSPNNPCKDKSHSNWKSQSSNDCDSDGVTVGNGDPNDNDICIPNNSDSSCASAEKPTDASKTPAPAPAENNDNDSAESGPKEEFTIDTVTNDSDSQQSPYADKPNIEGWASTYMKTSLLVKIATVSLITSLVGGAGYVVYRFVLKH